ncbi:MFS transporter [Cryobacterium ruanii]|uniref:MFS transporter n=1 Tax=Cryobacterium ruanii TaxID=1259197 RepID=A0A4R9AMJ1_9MICO|nr:MFS transporter [Cryobacterium ruanii]TFD64250.1 MFS transporter [Cryobacterium ruanii]
MTTSTTTLPQVMTVTLRDVKRATWIAFFAWTFAVYDFVLFGNLLPAFSADMGWSAPETTNIVTWVTIGTALVAFAIGPIVDRIGRRKGIIIAVAGAAVASLLTAVAGPLIGILGGVGVVFLVLVRSIAGLGYAEQAINATYLNEMFSKVYTDPSQAKRRGLIYSLVQSGWPVGSVLAAGSVYLLFPIGGWPLAFVVGAFPAIFILIAARWLKESPQFVNRRAALALLAEGRTAEARAFAAEAGVDIEDRATPLRSVFRGESLRALIFVGIGFFLSWFGVLVFVILGTTILTAEDGKGINFSDALVILIISNATAFLGYLFHGWFGDRIGRRNAIAIGWVLSAISFAAMLLAPSGGGGGLTITLYSAGLFFLIGPFAALLFFTGESFPVHTRATGSAIINAGGQVGAILAGVGVTASLTAGSSWIDAAMIWGVVPVFIAAILILFSKNVNPKVARTD